MEKTLKAIAGTSDRPLVIGHMEIPCYVLEDETRVLSQRGVISSVNATRGGPRGQSDLGAEMPRFASQNWLKPCISNDLELALKSPILFQPPTGASAFGYPATMLVDLCDAIMEAESLGTTTVRQKSIVDRARTLLRGFATVGIIAFVDEATGYQEIRNRRALETILKRFIAKELQPWTKTLPYEFYELIYKLKKWPGPDGHKRPSVIGRYTNDLVYQRLAPGVLEELRQKNPTTKPGQRRDRHHQWFTPDLGHPRLKEHLEGVMALMRASPNWDAFKRNLTRAYPKHKEPIPLALGDDE